MFNEIVEFYINLIESLDLHTVSRIEIENYMINGKLISKMSTVNREKNSFVIRVFVRSDLAMISAFLQSTGFFEDFIITKDEIRFRPKIFTVDIINNRRNFFNGILERFNESLRRRRTSLIEQESKLEKNKENMNNFRKKIDQEQRKASQSFITRFEKFISKTVRNDS